MGQDAPRALVDRATRSTDPCQALQALTELRRAIDDLERRQVARALAAGRSYAEVARALGVSRQAAHRRYRELGAALSGRGHEAAQDGGPPARP